MPAGHLGAWVRANPKVALGGVAATAALLLGVRAKKTGKAAPGGAPAKMATSQASQRGALPTYDSTASDVYNSMQPEIDALYRQLNAASNPHDVLNPARSPMAAATPLNAYAGQKAMAAGSAATVPNVALTTDASGQQWAGNVPFFNGTPLSIVAQNPAAEAAYSASRATYDPVTNPTGQVVDFLHPRDLTGTVPL